jgi:hypothetical protein
MLTVRRWRARLKKVNMQRKCTAWWLLLVGLTVAPCAFAQRESPDADRLKTAADEYDAGRRAFKLQEFEKAAAHFENADRDAPSAEALLGAIRSRIAAQQKARAATLAALGLARYPDDKAVGDLARQTIAEAAPSFHKVIISCTPACSFAIDNKVTPYPEGTSAVVFVEPGPHAVMAGWSGKRRGTKELTAVPGGQTQIAFSPPAEKKDPDVAAPVPAEAKSEVDADASVSGAPEVAPKKSGLTPAVFIAGLGATAVLAGVTIWSGIDTQNNPGQDRVRNECQDTNCEIFKDGLAREHRTNALLAATGVVGVATAVIGAFFTDFGGGTDKSKAVVSPVVAVSGGVMVGAAGRFR